MLRVFSNDLHEEVKNAEIQLNAHLRECTLVTKEVVERVDHLVSDATSSVERMEAVVTEMDRRLLFHLYDDTDTMLINRCAVEVWDPFTNGLFGGWILLSADARLAFVLFRPSDFPHSKQGLFLWWKSADMHSGQGW